MLPPKGVQTTRVLTDGNYALPTVLYNPKAFITHAASLRHACAHCGRFSTAASRRSLGSVSVPVWPDTLSGRLAIIALVGRYPTNKLIARKPLQMRQLESEAIFRRKPAGIRPHPVLATLSSGCPDHLGRSSTHYSPVRHSTRSPKETFAFDLHA